MNHTTTRFPIIHIKKASENSYDVLYDGQVLVGKITKTCRRFYFYPEDLDGINSDVLFTIYKMMVKLEQELIKNLPREWIKELTTVIEQEVPSIMPVKIETVREPLERKAKVKKNKNKMRPCVGCNCDFQPVNRGQKFCSLDCINSYFYPTQK